MTVPEKDESHGETTFWAALETRLQAEATCEGFVDRVVEEARQGDVTLAARESPAGHCPRLR